MKRKILPIILMFSALFTQAQENGGGGFFITPSTSLEEDVDVFNPEKAAQLQNCFFNPQDYCITLQPGESGCINIPVPSLPITEWYDLNITIKSIPTGATPVFVLEPVLLNSNGSGNVLNTIRESGGCASGHYTFLRLESGGINGYNFSIWNDYNLGG